MSDKPSGSQFGVIQAMAPSLKVDRGQLVPSRQSDDAQGLVEGVEINSPQPLERPRDLARADEIRVNFIGDGENGIAHDDALVEIQKALGRHLQRIKNSSALRIWVAAPLNHHACSIRRSQPTWAVSLFYLGVDQNN